MKIALVNPPAQENIIRRWRCAIEQGHYLFPPLELCYLAAILKQKQADYLLADCIADRTGRHALISKLRKYRPDMIVFMPGFETINQDIREMEAVLDEGFTPELIPGGFSARCVNQHEQKYTYTSDPEAPVIRARLRKDGYFWSKLGRHWLSLSPLRYHDYNF